MRSLEPRISARFLSKPCSRISQPVVALPVGMKIPYALGNEGLILMELEGFAQRGLGPAWLGLDLEIQVFHQLQVEELAGFGNGFADAVPQHDPLHSRSDQAHAQADCRAHPGL